MYEIDILYHQFHCIGGLCVLFQMNGRVIQTLPSTFLSSAHSQWKSSVRFFTMNVKFAINFMHIVCGEGIKSYGVIEAGISIKHGTRGGGRGSSPPPPCTLKLVMWFIIFVPFVQSLSQST